MSTVVDVFAERKKREIMQDTWGHLAPKKGNSYKGYMIWAYGGWGDIILLDAAFEKLSDSPWLFNSMQEYIGEHFDSEGLYKWEGYFKKLDKECYRFVGKIKKLDFKDVF